ncbi:ferritin-like domain-containing protein [Haladaptatus pallidirubidus]|uniref:ferritin-like domain-containing protein n=1 Tax=Haladaptatus pallidirubidus TaxID=1008152 RepID=UPI001D125F30|nr:ferritin-like domain-containing protein [Haladaptatus pallidirubidus]
MELTRAGIGIVGADDHGGDSDGGSSGENTGVAAYAGATPSIENKDILAAAVTIHSVEARSPDVVQRAQRRLAVPRRLRQGEDDGRGQRNRRTVHRSVS